MGITTVSLDEETRERLENYKHPDHPSMDETLDGIMEILPTVEDVQSGCANCGDEPWKDRPTEYVGGTIQFFHTEFEDSDVFGSTYFCSPECAKKAQDEVDKHVPQEPDLVRVGGADEMAAEFGDATFHLDRDRMSVGIPLPGAFAGGDDHGNEYDYIGEPAYVKNEGDWVQHGTIEEIIHEETYTGLILGNGDYETVMLNHPDEERRSDYEDVHAEWHEIECPGCEKALKVCETEMPAECPECETEITADDLPNED